MLEIINARYFVNDVCGVTVTDELRKLIRDDSLNIVVSNDIAGDPCKGQIKNLFVRYSLDGCENEMTILEGGLLQVGPGSKTINEPPKHEPQPGTPQLPRSVDIIIPTYNNVELTKACFRSIKEHTLYPYRVIWVDNGSTDMTEAEKELEGVNRICIYLPKNLGFVGAVNEGLRVSNADAVCLLNNDTEVSSRWLNKLIKTLYADKEMGIIGPLTGPPAIFKRYDSHHNITYQQHNAIMPALPYYKNLEDFNKRIESQFVGKTAPVDFVAFLCALIKREVIEKVGLLDTGFDFGMWDDCDWNMSAKAAGYQVALAWDTCIIHKGRSTFKVIEKKEGLNVDALITKNKQYLDEKWAKKRQN